MDAGTIVGLILGASLVLLAIAIGGDPHAYLNPQSILIVLGGTVAATLTAYPLERVIALPRIVLRTVTARPIEIQPLIGRLVQLSDIARRDGILSLEGKFDDADDPFLVRGIQLAVDGGEPDAVESVMKTELATLVDRHESGRGMLECLGRYAPAFGMIGTLIGLVAMLSQMGNPDRIGQGMAAALLTTLYGALLANVVFLPLADKLGQASAQAVLAHTIIIHGVRAIQVGENPRQVELALRCYLEPEKRDDSLAKAA